MLRTHERAPIELARCPRRRIYNMLTYHEVVDAGLVLRVVFSTAPEDGEQGPRVGEELDAEGLPLCTTGERGGARRSSDARSKRNMYNRPRGPGPGIDHTHGKVI